MNSHWFRFLRWYFTPIETLRGLPNGDGAFAAFALSLALYERFIRCDLKYNQGKVADDKAFRASAKDDLGVSQQEFEAFWNIYRHGINHQGSPKKFKSDGKVFNWEMSEQHEGRPTFRTEQDGSVTILINPWKFWEYVFQKYESSPSILEKSDSFAFGEIY